ncbi:MAG: T9SS type A sorting domain-containing protein [Bacteroidota bacterium]
MKKILLLLACFSLFAANAQNGFTTYTTNLSITGNAKTQTAFLLDNNSNKWIGYRTITSGTNIANAGLVKYDNTNWTLYNNTSIPAFPSNYVTSLAKDNSGNIWIGCDSGLVKFDGSVFTTYSTNHGLPAKLVNCVEVIGNQVYVGTNSGLSRFDGINFTNYNVSSGTLPDNVILSIKAESSNLLWLGGNSRLIEFNINGTFTSTSYVNHSLSAFKVNCIYIDSQNEKWLGTTQKGILKYNGSVFQNASDLYEIFGSRIPINVFDLMSGPHNGVTFVHQNGSGSSSYSGLTELSPDGMVYQYFYPVSNYPLGKFLEKEGSNILILDGQGQKIYQSLNSQNNVSPLGAVNVHNFKTLDINQVKAGMSNRSDMHWDIGGTQNPAYEVPKGSGANSSIASALWIGGLDAGNQLHGGAQTYRQNGVDFWPGPLDTINATIDTATSKSYDKIWKVSYTDINTFINAYNSGSVIATPDMLTWPAHGAGNNSRNLAPFVDFNGDGLYNPNDGDYPKIKGDQTLYFIYNDKLAAHSTSFTPMGIEVQGMAYAYGCPDAVNGRNELAYTTFYDYKIINRSSMNYHDVYVSMFSDVDLGYYGDDYIGSNVADNYGYAYNGDAFDDTAGGSVGYGSHIPAQGFNIVKGPVANVNDGIDNNNNGIVDETGEDCKLNKLTYFLNEFAGMGSMHPQIDPRNSNEYYNYMTGFWRDGNPFTCGGNGYGGTVPSGWMYPGDPNNNGVSTDPSNTCGYWKETGVAGDRRMILGSGPFTLNAGQMQEVEYAFVTSFDSSSSTNSRLLSVAKLKTDIQKINTFYNQMNKPNCLQTIDVGMREVIKQNDFSFYPNPAKSLLYVAANIEGISKIQYVVVDVLGKQVLSGDNNSGKFSININDLNSGIYFLRLLVNNSVVVKKFVRE